MLCWIPRWRVTRVVSVACVLLGIATSANPASAAPLNLSSTHLGDVTTHYTSVSYVLLDANPLPGTLTVAGEPDEFDVNSQFIWDGVFSRLFSSSNCLSRVASPAFMPPYWSR